MFFMGYEREKIEKRMREKKEEEEKQKNKRRLKEKKELSCLKIKQNIWTNYII